MNHSNRWKLGKLLFVCHSIEDYLGPSAYPRQDQSVSNGWASQCCNDFNI